MADPSLDDIMTQLQAQYGASAAPATDTPAPGFDPYGNALPAGSWDASVPATAVPASSPAPAVQTAPPAAPPPSVTPVAGGSAPPSNPYATRIAMLESGDNPNARNPQPGQTSSGRYGITDPTMATTLANHPELAGADKNDPRVMAALTADNGKALEAAGFPATEVNLHAAHFLGAAGAVKFLTAMKANPDTPVTQAVSPEALAANHANFFAKDGTPYTVGQVYASVAKGFDDGSQSMPAHALPPGTPSNAGNTIPTGTPGDAVYGQQKKDIAAYIASQPAMWQKLQDMQRQYQQASQPTMLDRLGDAMSQYQQQAAVADANMHANAGGVLLNANPSSKDFVNALQSSHQIDLDARNQRLNQADRAYQMGSNALLAQNAQGATNLGLSGSLAKDTGEYNLAAAANALKLAQFGNEQATQLAAYAEKMIPNPETRARVMTMFTQGGGNPTASLAANMSVIDNLTAKVQAGTPATPATDTTPGTPAVPPMQISAKEPAKMFSITTFDPTANDGAGGQKVETVNAATPEGQARLKQVTQIDPTAKIADLGAPSTNVSVSNGSGEGAGGSGAPALATQHEQAGTTKQAAQAALQLLPFIEQHGGTGVLTDSPEGKAVASGIKQAIGLDVTGLPVREVYDKLMQQVQNGLTMPGLKAFGGRPAASEFKILQAGQLGATATTQAAKAFLQHVADTMDYTQSKLEAQSDAQLKARQQNNTYFDPENWAIKYQKSNLPPVWHGQDLLDAVQGKTNPDGSVTPPTDVSKPLASPQQAQSVIDWARSKLGIGPSAPVAPARPQGQMPPLFPQQGGSL